MTIQIKVKENCFWRCNNNFCSILVETTINHVNRFYANVQLCNIRENSLLYRQEKMSNTKRFVVGLILQRWIAYWQVEKTKIVPNGGFLARRLFAPQRWQKKKDRFIVSNKTTAKMRSPRGSRSISTFHSVSCWNANDRKCLNITIALSFKVNWPVRLHAN